MSWIKKLFKTIIWAVFSLLVFILFTNVWIVQTTKSRIYEQEDVPKNDVALVLGTSKHTRNGQLNRFFTQRMYTAAALHSRQHIKHILVSGDNGSKYYNEPKDMLKALGNLNVPASDISLDFAGFRTLDSVVRSKEVFGQHSLTIVTQQFHCYRSLFIANYYGIDAVAVSADHGESIGLSLAIREILARSFAVLDLYVFSRKPKYLGESIELDIR